MERYIGTKEILAKPMRLGEYNSYRGWDMPANEDPAKPGFLVEYTDGEGGNHPNHEGYVSWTPEGPFLAAYRASGYMTFGHALDRLKKGDTVARSGWNGKNMFLFLNRGSHDAMPPAMERGPLIDGVDPSLFEKGDTGTVTRLPNINMRAASGATVTGWLASQTDLLAEDWTIVNRAEEIQAPAVAEDPVVPAMTEDAGQLDAADEGAAD